MHARLIVASAALLTAAPLCSYAWSAQSTPAAPASTQPSRTLVIVHAMALRDAAEAWRGYRSQRGWVVRLQPVKTAEAGTNAQRDAIQADIRAAHRAAQPRESDDFAVLLLGDDDALPAWRFPQSDPLLLSDDDREYITDQPYQFADDADGKPDFALGRVPARDNAEALAYLNKVKAHERGSESPHIDATEDLARRRITYVAGEGHFGPMDALLETLFIMMVDQFVPDAFDLSMTYAKPSSIYCPPPSRLTSTVLQRLGEGALLFNYVGHGHDRGLDSLHWNNKRIPILRVGDLQRLDDTAPDDRARPIAFMSCCSVGHFDLAGGEPCLSEALLFHPAGPIVVISGSRITHPYANTVLQKDITHALLVERAPTAGMLDLLAERSLLTQDATDRELDFVASTIARSMKWQTSLRDLRSMHARMYNLLGDPATEISLPALAVKNLQIDGQTITGRVEGMKAGRVTLRIETPRVQSAKPGQLQPLVGDNDPDLERKAAINYPLANDRLLLKFEGEVRDGAFSVQLPAALPGEAGAIRAYASGVNDRGEAMEAIGALRLREAASAHGTKQPQ